MGGLGANHPVLSYTLPLYLPHISPGTHLELGQLWLSFQSQTTNPRPKLNKLGTLGFEPSPSQTKGPESSASIHSARTAHKLTKDNKMNKLELEVLQCESVYFQVKGKGLNIHFSIRKYYVQEKKGLALNL